MIRVRSPGSLGAEDSESSSSLPALLPPKSLSQATPHGAVCSEAHAMLKDGSGQCEAWGNKWENGGKMGKTSEKLQISDAHS